ncbi:MAG: lipoprotein-releasing ABC transporter permease subunit [Nitrospirota bacterium]|nr:MAG: lipoprotein-releasing ABC transporter permease subunit [Nitrospirota bacterium]
MSKKKRKSVSFNTIVSVGGVAVGVMALLIVLSVMSGFHEDLQNKILGVNAHVVVLSFSGGIPDYEEVLEKAKEVDGVRAASPFLMGQVMLAKNKRAHGVYIRGIETKYETETTEIHRHMRDGQLSDINREGEFPGIIIGKELASSLGVSTGDSLNVISPVGQMGPLGMLPRARKFIVRGTFEMGMYEYDANLALATIGSVQDFLKLPGQANAIELKLDNIFEAPRIKRKVAEHLGPRFYARDWMEMNRNLFAALKLEKLTMFIILTLIILVAAFNIVSTLIMNVIEKEREIAILKTMGASNNGIMFIFVIQGLMIGLIGTAIGLTGGYVISYLINTFEIIKLPADVYYLSHLPAKINLIDFALVCISAILISFIATIYPARQAAKLDPVDALRYE